jgi:hypothetical protein
MTTQGNLCSIGYVYPGQYGGGFQQSWFLGSHGSYGLYVNTGLYAEGPVWMSSFASRGAASISGNLTITTGGLDVTGYSYIRTPGGSGDASLFLMNPAAGGLTQNYRLMSYGGVFRIWNGDNGAELFTMGGAGNAGLAGSLQLGSSLREYNRSVPNGVAQTVQAADYVHGQLTAVSGQIMLSTIGKTANMVFSISGTFTSGTIVNVTIPFGITPAGSFHAPISVNHAGEAWHHGLAAFSTGLYYVTCYDVHLGAIPDGSPLWLYGSVTFPIN